MKLPLDTTKEHRLGKRRCPSLQLKQAATIVSQHKTTMPLLLVSTCPRQRRYPNKSRESYNGSYSCCCCSSSFSIITTFIIITLMIITQQQNKGINAFTTMSHHRLSNLGTLKSLRRSFVEQQQPSLLLYATTSSMPQQPSPNDNNNNNNSNNNKSVKRRRRRTTTIKSIIPINTITTRTTTSTTKSSTSTTTTTADISSTVLEPFVGTAATTTTTRSSTTSKRSKQKQQLQQQEYQLEMDMLNHDLLSKDDEYALSQTYQKAKQLQNVIDTILEEKRLQQEEEEQEQEVSSTMDGIFLNELDINDEFDNDDNDDDDEYDLVDELYDMKNTYNNRNDNRDVTTSKEKQRRKSNIRTYSSYFEYQQDAFDNNNIVQKKSRMLQDLDDVSRTTMASLLFAAGGSTTGYNDGSNNVDDSTVEIIDPGRTDHYILSINDLSDEDIYNLLQLSGGRKEMESILLEGARARDVLIRSNLKLVSSICKKWARMSSNKGSGNSDVSDTYYSIYSGSWDRPSLSEAIQEGVIGLATAVERFDPTRGLRFSTYATYWITNSVRQCFQRSSTGCLKLPINFYDTRTRFKTLVRRYYEMEGAVPSIDVLAKEMGLSQRRLQLILSLTQPLVSMDGLLMPRGTITRAGKAGNVNRVEDQILLSDTLADTNQDGIEFGSNPMDRVELSFLRQQLEHAMAVELVPFERDVLRLRLGLDDGVTRTCRQVAEVCGDRLSASEIRTVENRALRKLRSPVALATYKLLTYLDFADVDMETITLT